MNKYKCHEFSLIELMVVVAIFSILASLFMPSINKTLEQSQVVACQHNLKQFYLSENSFANDHSNDVFYWGYDELEFQDRIYWNNPRSRFAPYVLYENLECAADPFVQDTESSKYYRDGISYGRNSYLHARKTNLINVINPGDKIFYSDSGHRHSDPVERTNARFNNLSSSLHIMPRSSWDMEGIYPRHHGRNANVLFFDGKVTLALDVFLNSAESFNYSVDRSMSEKHWDPYTE